MLALDDACRQLFYGGYALRHAARQGHAEDVRSLLSSGVHPDAVSRQQHRLFRPWIHGRTALWHAVAGRHFKVVELLLGHGADPNAVGWMSSTPLWTACCMGQAEMVVRLLAAGADPNLMGCRGSPPLLAWLGSLAVPHVLDPSCYGASEEAMAIGALLSNAGAEMGGMEEVLAQSQELLLSAGYSADLLDSSRELQSLRAEHEARLLQGLTGQDQTSNARTRL